MARNKPKTFIHISEKQWKRFWSKVDRSNLNGCWPWMNSRINTGYGQFEIYPPGIERISRAGRKNYLTHRLAYFYAFGDPGENLVLHKCDNKPCCNPAHLFLGTDADNMKDFIQKNGRARLGLSQRVLNETQVREIRALLRTMRIPDIASRYRVGVGTVYDIKDGRSWSHVA